MLARLRGGGRFTECNSRGGKTKPHLPATIQQPEVPAGTIIAERGHEANEAPEDELAGDPYNQAFVPGVRQTQSVNWEN